MNLSRRSLLKGAVMGAAGTALAGGGIVTTADAADAETSSSNVPSYPFHGPHQAGILTPAPEEKQSAACFASFDLTATSKAEVAELMQTITKRSRFLATGGQTPAPQFDQPPPDSDVLGPIVPADGLTVTLAFGASLFDDRYGLADQKPKRLTPMRIFPDDSPNPAWLHGDLLVQLCANSPDTVHHAIRDLAKHTRGAMQPRWKIEGYASPPRPSGTARNLLGFKDGTANPVGNLATSLVWVDDPSEPAWALGGSYQVVRLIRMLVEFWDRVSLTEQEGMFGRRKNSGAPLDGNSEFDTPNYAADPDGEVIPLTSHIRLANPRTSATADQRLLRRSYNYDLGLDANGNIETGHVFVCFQQDVHRQFETVQTRLIGEPLIDYVQPFGGGYFFVAPGVADEHDWYGRQLLA